VGVSFDTSRSHLFNSHRKYNTDAAEPARHNRLMPKRPSTALAAECVARR